MGKGNRARNERAGAVLATSAPKKTEKKQMPTWFGTFIVVAILVLLVLVTALTVLNNRGVFLQMQTAASSDHYEISVPMMSYMLYTEYQSYVSNYSSYLSYISGTGGTGLDTSKPLSQQNYSVVTDEATGVTETTTWFDYFAKMAINDANQVLLYCEYANRYGMSLDDTDRANIDRALDQLKQNAASAGYAVSDYLPAMYGRGVTLKQVRRAMEMTTLASKYSTLRREEITNAVTEARIAEYYEANKTSYETAMGYIGTTYTATFTPYVKAEEETEEFANEKNAALYAAYEAEQTKYNDRVTQLEAAADLATFKSLLKGYFYEDALDKLKAEKLAALQAEDPAVTELTPEDLAACEALAETQARGYLETAAVDNYKNSGDGNELDNWLFPSEGERAVGDTTKTAEPVSGAETVEEATVYTEATSNYAAYAVTAGLHADETSVVRDVSHILFKTDTFNSLQNTDTLSGAVKELADGILARGEAISAAAMANELLDKLKEEGKIVEKTAGEGTYYAMDPAEFAEIGAKYTEDSSVEYDAVNRGDMVTEFDSWLFDGARQVGEITYPEAVLTEYGYHIMLYRGEDQTWRSEIVSTLVDTDFNAWYESISGTCNITINDKAIAKIAG